ncbi:MAG: hypothetical protein AB1489_23925, partial [Acidobacteriota bacterium]
TISTYGYDDSKYKNAKIVSRITFDDSKANVKKILGKNFSATETKFGTSLFDYLEQGISLFFENDKLKTIHIYEPLNRTKTREYSIRSATKN